MSSAQFSKEAPEEGFEPDISVATEFPPATDPAPAIQDTENFSESNKKAESTAATETPPGTDLVPATQSSRRSLEAMEQGETIAVTKAPSPMTEPSINASSSSTMSHNHPTPARRDKTHSTPLSKRFRATKEVLTIMSPIREERSRESGLICEGNPQNPAIDTDLATPGKQSKIPAPSLPSNVNPQSDLTPIRPISPSKSQQAADYIAGRTQANPSPQQPFTNRIRPGQMVEVLLATPPLFSYNQPHSMTNCWLQGCGSATVSSDNRTVACPRCGDHSYVRYCCSTHLLSDMKEHYIDHCGRRQNLLHIDESTMTPVRGSVREFVRVNHKDHDSVERHRQALYHAYPPESETTNNSTRAPADYYVFGDADRFDAQGLRVTVANLYDFRGAGSIAGRVKHNPMDPKKELFAIMLRRLLALGVSAGTVNDGGCRRLFMWIKENLVGQGAWTEIMITRMCLAMQLEFGWRVDKELRK